MSDPSQRLVDEQTAAERRALRADYRAIYGEVVEGKEQLANAKSANLRTALERVGSLHERAQRPKEYAVDAEVFAQLAACGLDMVRRGAASSKNRMPADFVAQLKAAFGSGVGGGGGVGIRRAAGEAAAAAQPREIDWASLGLAAAANGVFATAPAPSTMNGPLGEAPKAPSDKKKAAAAAAASGRRKRSRLTAEEMEAAGGPKVVPREVTDDLGAANPDGDDKQETDRQMDAMWESLMDHADPDAENADANENANGEKCGASRTYVDVAALVVNHVSFAQTVENLFTLSFLVRDQRVKLEHDPEMGLIVRPFSLEQQRAIKEGSAAVAAAAGAAGGAAGAAAGGPAAAGGRGVGGRNTRGGGSGQRQQQQQQQQRMAQQFVVRFTHEDWEIMKAIVPRGRAVTPHRVLGAGLEREEQQARADAALAQQQARREERAREAAARQQDAQDEQQRAAQRARRLSERERVENELRALNRGGMEEDGMEEEGDENAGAGGAAGGGAGGGGKKRARGSGGARGGGGGGGGGGGVVDLLDDVDVVDNRTGKVMRV